MIKLKKKKKLFGNKVNTKSKIGTNSTRFKCSTGNTHI